MANNSFCTDPPIARPIYLAAIVLWFGFSPVLLLPNIAAGASFAQESAETKTSVTAKPSAQANASVVSSVASKEPAEPVVSVITRTAEAKLISERKDSLTAIGAIQESTKPKVIDAAGIVPAASSTKAANAAEAERLYNEAIEFYTVERYARAFDLGHECCALAPQNPRYRAGLAVFASKDRPLLYSLSTAKEAARLAPHDANALTNLGSMLQKNGQRVEAVDRYKKAEAINSKDYRPRLGIAQCLCIDGNDGLAIAEQELKAACDTPEDSTEKWANLGATYFILRLFPHATTCFNRGLELDPKNYYLECMRLKSALAEHDKPTVKALVGDVLSDKLLDPDVALALALLPDNDFSPDLKHKLLTICQRNFFTRGEFFYQLARNFEAGSHLDMAYEAYQIALKAAPGECQYIVSEIGNRLAAGRNDEAFAIWGQSSTERNKVAVAGSIFRDKGPFSHVLDSVGVLLQSDSSGVRIARAKLKNIKCG
jgi:tetratricopeptide (TPR) repeat protein